MRKVQKTRWNKGGVNRFTKFKIFNLNKKKTSSMNVFVKINAFQSILDHMFGLDNYDLYDFQYGAEIGHPDFMVKINGEELYIEWKNLGDGLRASQIEWMYNNPEKETILIMRLD